MQVSSHCPTETIAQSAKIRPISENSPNLRKFAQSGHTILLNTTGRKSNLKMKMQQTVN
jgi:hypothetical protein